MSDFLSREELELLEDAVGDITDGAGSIRDGYSGRSMLGRKCVGVVVDNAVSFAFKLAAFLAADGSREAETLLEKLSENSVSTDSMGYSTIVYWPWLESDEL